MQYKQGIINKTVLMSVVLSLLVPVSFATAQEYGGFGGRPAFPDPDRPETESAFIHTLTPGSVKEEGIVIINNTDETKTLAVYPTDSTIATGGVFTCEQRSESRDGVGAWINLEKSEVTLAAGETELIPFTINVSDVAGVGEHSGCILVQEQKKDVPGRPGVTLSLRTGTRVYITIPGLIVRDLEIVGFTVDTREGKGFVLRPQVKNLGNVSIDANIEVVTRNMFGVVIAEHGGSFPLSRSITSDWNFNLDKPFWGGFYKTSFVVEYDKAQSAVIGASSSEELVRLVGPSVWYFSAPTTRALLIEITVLLLFMFGLFLLLLSRKRNKWIKTKWVTYVVQKGDDVKKIADKFDVSWKVLVKANKLEAPYLLTTEDVIKVPPSTGAIKKNTFAKKEMVMPSKKKTVVRKRKVKKEEE